MIYLFDMTNEKEFREAKNHLIDLGFYVSKNDLFYIEKSIEQINEIEVTFEIVEYDKL